MDQLRTCLLDLLHELRNQNIPLTIGGGFGLFLKREYLRESRVRTLFSQLPAPRTTNDIDVFFRVDLFTNKASIEVLSQAIHRLGYVSIETAKYYQWTRSIVVAGVPLEVKLDALVGPVGDRRNELRVDSRRVKPKDKGFSFHAHASEEALFLEDDPIAIELEGNLSTGESYKGIVSVPEAFPYLMMKLSAFADRKADKYKDLGQHHALDAYTIVGMMTEREYDRALDFAIKSRKDPRFRKVCKVVADDFADLSKDRNPIGRLQLREHPLFQNDFRLDEFIAILSKIFSQQQ